MIKNDIYHKYNKYLDIAIKTQNDIELLQWDRYIVESGWEISWAVDFSEIKPFIHPFISNKLWGVIRQLPDETESDMAIRAQTVINYIFLNRKNLIILPPYQIELYDYLQSIKSNIGNITNIFRDKYENIIKNKLYSNKRDKINSILNKHCDYNELDDGEKKDIIEYFMANHKDMFTLYTLNERNIPKEYDIVNNLLKDNVLIPFSRWNKDINIKFNEVEKASIKYLKEMKIRDQAREYSSYLDSLALGYMEIINKHINKKNKILLLITRSTYINSVLNNEDNKTIINDKKVELSRGLEYLLNEIRTKRPEKVAVDKQIEETIRIARKFVEINQRNRRTFGGDNFMDDSYQIIDKNINELKTVINSRENIDIAIALNNINSINPYINKEFNVNEKIFIEEMFSLIKNEDAILGADAYRNNIRNEIYKKLNNIELIFDSDEEYFTNVKFEIDQKYRKTAIMMKPLESEMPIEIIFYNKNAKEYASKISSIIEKRVINRQIIIECLIELIEKTNINPEFHLIRSYLIAMISDYKAAKEEAIIGVEKEKGPRRKEYIFLIALYSRILEEYNEGIKWCLEGINIDKNDARINREMSVLLWQYLKESIKTCINENDLKGKISNEKIDINMVIKYAEHALRNSQNINIKSQTLNSLVYYYIEKYKINQHKEDIDIAGKYMDNLIRIIAMDKWISRFHDTYGVYLFQKPCDEKVHIENLKKAKIHIEIALKDNKLPEYEKNIIKEHYEEVKIALKKLL